MTRLGFTWRETALAVVLAMSATAGWGQAPEGWTSRDLGGAAPEGSAAFDEEGVWTVTGGGRGVEGTADQLQFVYREMTGDGSFVARLAAAPEAPARAGIMLREGDAPGARSLFLAPVAARGVVAHLRAEADAPIQILGEEPLLPGEPVYLRLQRAGNEVQGFVSTDGRLWRAVAAPRTLALPETVQVGLAVASGAEGNSATATFDAVSLHAGLVSPTALVACGADSSALLTWRPAPRAAGYMVYRGGVGGGIEGLKALTDRPVTTASYSDTAAGLTNGAPVLYAVTPILREVDGTLREGMVTAAATTPALTPGPRACSIGEPIRAPGKLLFDAASGVYTLSATGSSLDGRADRFFFAVLPMSGDFEVTVQVLVLPATARDQGQDLDPDPDQGQDQDPEPEPDTGEEEPAAPVETARVGLMVRESVEPGARFFMATVSPADGVGLLWRGVADAPSDGPGEPIIERDQVTMPLWLRVTRAGNILSAAISKDGKEFESLGPPYEFFDNLPGTLEVGIALTGAGSDRPALARLSDFAIEPR